MDCQLVDILAQNHPYPVLLIQEASLVFVFPSLFLHFDHEQLIFISLRVGLNPQHIQAFDVRGIKGILLHFEKLVFDGESPFVLIVPSSYLIQNYFPFLFGEFDTLHLVGFFVYPPEQYSSTYVGKGEDPPQQFRFVFALLFLDSDDLMSGVVDVCDFPVFVQELGFIKRSNFGQQIFADCQSMDEGIQIFCLNHPLLQLPSLFFLQLSSIGIFHIS